MTSAVAPSAGITGPLVSPDAKRVTPEDGGRSSRLPQCPCPTASAHEVVDAKPIGLQAKLHTTGNQWSRKGVGPHPVGRSLRVRWIPDSPFLEFFPAGRVMPGVVASHT